MDLYKQIANLPPEKRELFELMLMEEGVDLTQIMIVPQKRDGKRFPLSYSQQRLWFLDQLEPDSALYNIPSVLRITGKLNIEALQKSFNEIVRRHEVLRTTFATKNGQPVQVIAPELIVEIPVTEIEEADSGQLDERIKEMAEEESMKPFNLQEGPLLRASLLKYQEEAFIFFVTMHHIVSDNWSTGLFVQEFLQLYAAYNAGKPSPLADLPLQYADFAAWQRKWLKGKTLENQVTYWREQLAGAAQMLEMPLDHPRPSYQTYNGDFIIFKIPAKNQKNLNELSRKHDATLFMTLLAAFHNLLYRYSGQDDICVGSPIANRNRAETEMVIGFFINTLVLRADLSENPAFSELLKRVKDMTLGSYAHQDLPFETLVEELHPERDMSHSPFFQAMFVLNNAPVAALELTGLKFELIEIENKTAKFDIVLNITEGDDGLLGKLEFNTDLYERSTMEHFSLHYQKMLESIIADPQTKISDLDILLDDEREKLLNDWNKAPRIYNESKTIVQLFEEQAVKTPQASALRVQEQEYTFNELNEKANILAGRLIDKGFASDKAAGIFVERSAEMIIAMIAVFKAGGVYLPLDPDYPQERLAFMLEDAKVPFLLTTEHLLDSLPSHDAEVTTIDSILRDTHITGVSNPKTNIKAEGAAYIIYTSGSTGKPKGVVVDHRTIANHCRDMVDYYKLTPKDNVLQFAALNFDASLEQILPTLISGATLFMRDNEIWPINKFHEKVTEQQLSVINLPTAYWNQLAVEWGKSPDMVPIGLLRLVIIGGDLMKIEALKQWQKTAVNDVRLLNAYGPTEAIITSTTYEIPDDFNGERIPIGKQRANREIYVTDPSGNPTPVGVPGELLIGGSALARGYLDRPKLTAERFIDNPFGEGRLYRTGDLVRFLDDGNLEFLGRVDDQVKIRGFRIELGEIESILQDFPGLKEVVVSAKEDKSGEKGLVAYFVAEDGRELTLNELRDFLKNKLPDYMIPSIFMALDEMPLSPAGKINRRALPEPEGLRPQLETEFVAPRTETEKKLAEMVKEILDIKKVGMLDSFFDLGGHSMMATQVVSRIREEFDVEISLRTLFEKPTVEGIALSITEAQTEFQDSDELESMLSEIEDLSDEDLEKLLNEE